MIEVGKIDERVVKLLGLNIQANTPIFIGSSNIEHMRTSHPEDFERYKDEISNIILKPDYVGMNPADKSIEYVKEFEIYGEFVKVAVRVSTSNVFFARSIFVRNPDKTNKFIGKGYLKKY